ncbi:hypothetical protein RI054_42g150180 [Pseudoscourfieldia marina]
MSGDIASELEALHLLLAGNDPRAHHQHPSSSTVKKRNDEDSSSSESAVSSMLEEVEGEDEVEDALHATNQLHALLAGNDNVVVATGRKKLDGQAAASTSIDDEVEDAVDATEELHRMLARNAPVRRPGAFARQQEESDNSSVEEVPDDSDEMPASTQAAQPKARSPQTSGGFIEESVDDDDDDDDGATTTSTPFRPTPPPSNLRQQSSPRDTSATLAPTGARNMSVQVGTQNDVGMQVDYDASTGLLYDVSYARIAHAPVVATSSASFTTRTNHALPQAAMVPTGNAIPSAALVDALAETYHAAATMLRGGFDRALATSIATEATGALARLRQAKARAERLRTPLRLAAVR